MSEEEQGPSGSSTSGDAGGAGEAGGAGGGAVAGEPAGRAGSAGASGGEPHLSKEETPADDRTDGRTDDRTDGRTDGSADGSVDGRNGELPAAAASSGLGRSRQHRVVGGVCAGLGRYFDLDPVVFRVPIAVLSLVGGLGLVFYGFAWLLVPEEGQRENELRRLLSGRIEGASLSAILAALVGCALFLVSLRAGYTSFALLVAGALGGAAYWSRRRRAETTRAEGEPAESATAHTVAEAPPETRAPPVPDAPSWWRDPLTGDAATASGDTGYLWGPDDGAPSSAAGSSDAASRRRRRRERRRFGALVFVLAVGAGVVAGGVTWPVQPFATSLIAALASALVVFGVGIVVGSFKRRLGGGTIVWAVVTAVLLTGASFLPKDMTADWGSTRWSPPAAGEVRSRYELGTGRAVLDLTEVGFPGQAPVRTQARVGAGELVVLVPDDVTVHVTLELGVGSYRLPARPGVVDEGRPGESYGGGVDVSGRHTLHPAGGGEARGTLLLDLNVGAGQAVVALREPDVGERVPGDTGTSGEGEEAEKR